ncbi:MAG TPA: ATP synthase F1 subunit epsilon [Armatimonadota bacterium]|jgi:F-type H+-transporting ATPase subunit epsilon
MADRSFHLDIVTPERSAYSNEVTSLVVMGADGYLGILAGHAPLMTTVGVGEIRITETGGKALLLACGGGFMQVDSERTVILAESAERADEIIVPRALEAEERARRRLSGDLRDCDDLDVARAELALARAHLRLKVAGGL